MRVEVCLATSPVAERRGPRLPWPEAYSRALASSRSPSLPGTQKAGSATLLGGTKPRSTRAGHKLLTATSVLPSLHEATSTPWAAKLVRAGRKLPLPPSKFVTPATVGCIGSWIAPSVAGENAPTSPRPGTSS